jgi:predicted choloylglycine hydrolase
MTEVKAVTYHHVVLEGTHYEVGRLQGELLKKNPEYIRFITTLPDEMNGRFGTREFEKALEFSERYCPGLNDEIQGFADSLGVNLQQIVYYAFSQNVKGNCSHFAVLPSITREHLPYVGRSYEWNLQDDFRLCTTRVSGQASHIGFSLLLFGRIDGLNEHGLCVTMSAGVPGSNPQEEGCKFWMVIRTLLERCRNVSEALELIQEIPIAFNVNLILADKTGEAALIEIACFHRVVKRIGSASSEQFLCSTNHFTLPEMLPYDANRRWHSIARYQAIESSLNAAVPNIEVNTIRGILSAPIPEGVCCHNYSEWFGTLWSLIMNPSEGKLEICFGSPRANQWYTFDINGLAGVQEYQAKLPDETAPPEFWQPVQSGN